MTLSLKHFLFLFAILDNTQVSVVVFLGCYVADVDYASIHQGITKQLLRAHGFKCEIKSVKCLMYFSSS